MQQAEAAAEDTVALLRRVGREGAVEEGAGGLVPGRVVERLMLAYMGAKVSQLVLLLLWRCMYLCVVV